VDCISTIDLLSIYYFVGDDQELEKIKGIVLTHVWDMLDGK
jgi:hypothetical protein